VPGEDLQLAEAAIDALDQEVGALRAALAARRRVRPGRLPVRRPRRRPATAPTAAAATDVLGYAFVDMDGLEEFYCPAHFSYDPTGPHTWAITAEDAALEPAGTYRCPICGLALGREPAPADIPRPF